MKEVEWKLHLVSTCFGSSEDLPLPSKDPEANEVLTRVFMPSILTNQNDKSKLVLKGSLVFFRLVFFQLSCVCMSLTLKEVSLLKGLRFAAIVSLISYLLWYFIMIEGRLKQIALFGDFYKLKAPFKALSVLKGSSLKEEASQIKILSII